jgi:predicted nuclease of restriction endonuclease-like RecB superfamily
VAATCESVGTPDSVVALPQPPRSSRYIWTPEYLNEKLAKIREVNLNHLLVAVSERLDCSADDFEGASNCVLWFKLRIRIYDLVELAETYAVNDRATD